MYQQHTLSDQKPQGLADMAAYYAEALGWAVVPAHWPKFDFDFDPTWPAVHCSCWKGRDCAMPGKHPLDDWREIETPTLQQVRKNFRSSRVNLAILTGTRSRLVVADADPRHGGCLEDFWARGWPQETVVEKTGGGGHHAYYACVESIPTVGGYGPGLEVKAECALVIATPSLHESNRRYAWVEGHAPWEIALAPLPDAIVADLQTRTPEPTKAINAVGGDGSEPNWFYDEDETLRMVINLLNKAIRTASLDNPQREARNPTAYGLGYQLGSLGLSDAEVAYIMGLYETAVGE